LRGYLDWGALQKIKNFFKFADSTSGVAPYTYTKAMAPSIKFNSKMIASVTVNYQASGYNTGYKVVTSRVHQTTHGGYKLSISESQRNTQQVTTQGAVWLQPALHLQALV
jgi:hypothetical protein